MDLWSEQLNGVVVSRALLPRLAGLRTLVFDSPNVGLDEWFWVWLAQVRGVLQEKAHGRGLTHKLQPLQQPLGAKL